MSIWDAFLNYLFRHLCAKITHFVVSTHILHYCCTFVAFKPSKEVEFLASFSERLDKRHLRAIADYDTNLGTLLWSLFNQKWYAGKLHQENVKFTKEEKKKLCVSIVPKPTKMYLKSAFYENY